MYRCQVTKKISKPGERMVKVVTKRRDKIYYRLDDKTGQQVEIGRGWEIVEEKSVLPEVAEKMGVLS